MKIESQRINHQQNKKNESDSVGNTEEFIARFAASNHFNKDEQDIAAIQCRNRNNIHKSENDTKQRRHIPKAFPIPNFRENATDSQETTQLGGALFRKDYLELFDIIAQRVNAHHDTFRNGLKESVLLRDATEVLIRQLVGHPNITNRINHNNGMAQAISTVISQFERFILICRKHY